MITFNKAKQMEQLAMQWKERIENDIIEYIYIKELLGCYDRFLPFD